jgi:hypothetical protein
LKIGRGLTVKRGAVFVTVTVNVFEIYSPSESFIARVMRWDPTSVNARGEKVTFELSPAII